MPALHIFNRRWNSATDHFALYAVIIFLHSIIWLFMYWIGLVAFTLPEECPDGTTNSHQYVAAYLMLGLYVYWAANSAAMLWVSLRGAPFEPSKRRWLPPLIYAYAASWVAACAILAYSIYVVYGEGDTCWSSGSKGMIGLMIFGAFGIMGGIVFSLFTTHILFGEVRPGVKWHAAKKGVSSCVGLYTWLLHKYRGPIPPLEELATEYLEAHGNVLDLDKSDVVAALVCGRLVQRERRRALMAARLGEAVGTNAGDVELGVANGGGGGGSGGSSGEDGSREAQKPQGHSMVAAGAEVEAGVVGWLRGVSRGSGVCITPSAMALQLAKGGMGAQEAAELCTTADIEGHVESDTLREALHWARFAAAAYGELGYMWTAAEEQSACSARRRLSQLAKQAQQAGAKKPSPAALAKDYASAKELLGSGDIEIVGMSHGDEARGQAAYFVAVDRERQCVVLSVSGQRQYSRMADGPVELPEDWTPAEAASQQPHSVHAGALAAAQQLLAELEAQGTLATLLSPAQRTSAGGAAAIGAASMAAPKPASMTSSIGSKVAPSPDSAEVPASCVAADATAAAATAAAAAASGKCGNTSRSGAVAAEGGKQSDECAGWQLVLTGHGQGAGVAVVLGCRLLRQYPGLKVWAFNPSGGLVGPALSQALAPSTVAIMLGKDAVPRASHATVATLVEEGMAGLARLRYNKSLMLVALLAEKLGPRCLRGRWLTPERALHPPEEVPAEALNYLEPFCRQQQRRQDADGAAKPAPGSVCLPGRVLYLRRIKPRPLDPHTACSEEEGPQGQGSVHQGQAEQRMEAGSQATGVGQERGCCAETSGCCGGCRKPASRKTWDAVWVSPEAVAAEGVLISKRAMHDHYVSRLLGVLRRLG